MGIPELVDGYECDYFDQDVEGCKCPYDNRFTQTFSTFEDYKNHMCNVHQCGTGQRRKVRKPVSKYLSKVRSQNAKKQHQNGSFQNTHVKKETLIEFVKLYDEFVQDIISKTRTYNEAFLIDWEKYFRITEADLMERSLEGIIDRIKNDYESYSRRQDRRWRETEDDLYEALY